MEDHNGAVPFDKGKIEAKLQSIIDNGTVSLHEAFQSIQQEWKQRQDVIVKPAALDFQFLEPDIEILHPETGKMTKATLEPYQRVKPIIHSSEDNEDYLDLTPHSYHQALGRASVPPKFAEKLLDYGEHDLLKTNLMTMFGHQAKPGLLFRNVGNLTKGILSPSYRRMDAGPIFQAFIEAGVDSGLRPHRGLNTESKYQLSMVYPTVMEPAKNEFVVYGLQVITSDYGSAAFALNMLILRIWCTNLATGLDVFRKVHIGSRIDTGENDIMQLSQRTVNLDTKTIASAVKDGVASSSGLFESLNGAIEKAAQEEVDLPSVLKAIRKKGIRQGIVDEVKMLMESKAVIETLPAEPSTWKLSNCLSLIANGHSGDEKLMLEKTAFDLLKVPTAA